MPGILSGFRGQGPDRYDVWKLVDRRTLDPSYQSHPLPQLVCDIDKTYLETDFESLMKIARIAFEDSTDKITVTGASDVLLTARWGVLQGSTGVSRGEPLPLHFVSSSPPQLRNTLEDKLLIDGLDWSSDTFKNQAYNLKRGKFNLLRQQVAYKSAAINRLIEGSAPGSEFHLIGDNAESDAFAYLGVKLYVEGRLSRAGYQEYLEVAEVSPQVAEDFVNGIAAPSNYRIRGIYIRNLPSSRFALYEPLTTTIRMFEDYFEMALHLIETGALDFRNLWPLCRIFHNRHGLELPQIQARLQAFRSRVTDTATHQAIHQAIDDAMEAMSPWTEDTAPPAERAHSGSLSQFETLSESELLQLAREWYKSLELARNPPASS